MSSVFLSYSREDLPIVESLEQELTTNGVSVWRDQEKIYTGETWPKSLGVAIAIADHEVLLLAWSKHAARSYYVEIEWCTALALKKRIIPCRFDDTPLPPSLTAFQVTDGRQLSKAIAGILASLHAPLERDPKRTTQVLQNLARIRDSEPRNVLAATRAVYDQRHWVVQGQVIHGENVTVNIDRSTDVCPKEILEKWQSWVDLPPFITPQRRKLTPASAGPRFDSE